jgi:GT2 family glycosyltransferase/glycosyltransferase involved in cell wall biosynthesis
MVTRLLHACGLYIGEKDELMPAQADNPDGFWEHIGFVSVNDAVLSQLGGAWDLPPKVDEGIEQPRLDPLRAEAELLIEGFASRKVWGWKDPRNSLTLPFWNDLLPRLKTLVVVRNPLEVAHSMHERNGTSYSFGLRLWEIYNRRLIQAAKEKQRLVTLYDLFFKNAEAELQRIVDFIGLPYADVPGTAALVTKQKRHTRFSIDDLVDAGVSEQAIELYQALISEAGGRPPETPYRARKEEPDLLSGSVSRLDASVPEKIARIEHLERELRQFAFHHEKERAGYERQIENIRDSLRAKSISLAASEAQAEELRNRLRQQMKATKRLCRLMDEVNDAAARLRASARWQLANPVAAIKAKLSPGQSNTSLGFGHLEKVVSGYRKWLSTHPGVATIDDQIQALISGSASEPKRRLAPAEPPEPTRPIEFPVHEQVDISVIIPVFNQFRFTQACLASLQEHTGAERFEVIVIDDCSTDVTAEVVPRIPGIVYLRNETNCGFIASCNRGAEKARGKYLVFLNNDTLVTEEWLGALENTFAEQPEAGIVGSKLLYPDGRLQEAGGIIWRDASGWNYGNSDDPAKPEYNYLREVDYCSAAALMIPKSLFQSVGGFDSRYAPAYYEDTDLAFKVRQAGYKVLYQPLSEIIHYEGASGGTDLSSGTKKHQNINRSTFAETWATELAPRPSNGDVTFLQRAPADRKNILVIDHYLPSPDRDSGSVRMFQILKLLRELGHRVTFIPDNLARTAPYAGELQKRGIQIFYHPYVKNIRDFLITHGSRFDAVVLSRCDFARKHIDNVRLYAPQSRIIFDTVDLHSLRTHREAKLMQDPVVRQKAAEKQQLEDELVEQADETWVVSPVEQQLLRKRWPHKSIEVVSNIVDVPGSRTPFSRRRDWLFIGGFQHTPNTDAVLFFLQKIYPLVSDHLRDAKFYIIGDKPPPEIIALASERVIVAGLQRDANPFFDSVRLSVAPLRFGAGVKGKINQSMALGVPVVATSIAAEGMELQDHEDILLADEPEDFAQALIGLYESEGLWTRLSENGIRKTRALYSPETARNKLEFLFGDAHLKAAEHPVILESEIAVATRS